MRRRICIARQRVRAEGMNVLKRADTGLCLVDSLRRGSDGASGEDKERAERRSEGPQNEARRPRLLLDPR